MVELVNLCKVYEKQKQVVHALRGVSLTIQTGEYVTIVGQSGSGKTTLMNIIGCLDSPTSGEYRLFGRPVRSLAARAITRLRGEQIGFVFQNFSLMPTMSALENVELPLLFRGVRAAERTARAAEALREVGLGDRLSHRPTELSGGQQQRVAIARALVGRPTVVLADEPTGNLDAAFGREIMGLLEQIHVSGRTVIVITHDLSVAARSPRVLRMEDGRIAP